MPSPQALVAFVSTSHRANGTNDLGYRIGDESLLSAGIDFGTGGRVIGSLQLNGRRTGRDAYLGDDVPSTEIDVSAYGAEGIPVIKLITLSALEPSSSSATRLVRGGGFYVNDERVANEKARFTAEQAIEGEIFVLQKGQRERRIVRLKKPTS